VALAERGAPFVLCAANHNAVGMLLPIEGNFEQSQPHRGAIAASQPTHKRMWAAIVRSKLEQQAAALEAARRTALRHWRLAAKVRVATPENLEAQGARRYWGPTVWLDFRRDQNAAATSTLC
jgi:CRISPR-associated protein Cas1